MIVGKAAIKIMLHLVLVSACLLFSISPALAFDAKELCLTFVEKKLSQDGGIYTNYLSTGEPAGPLAAGHSILSESQGLMLAFYVGENNLPMADMTVKFLVNRLDTGKILSYRLNEDGKRYTVNAAVDDLRFIGGLLEAADTFHRPEYRDLAATYARRLYHTNVTNHMLADFYDEKYDARNKFATLCYADLNTMKAVSVYDGRWIPVMENMRKIVLGGYLSDVFPFFHTRYNFQKEAYESDRILMVESLLTALHLSYAGALPGQTAEYLKKALSEGKLYASYDVSGNPLTDTESTAVYALCALIGASEGDAQLYEDAIARMLLFQVTDKNSPVYGAFADGQTLEAYSFDNLTALLALFRGRVFKE